MLPDSSGRLDLMVDRERAGDYQALDKSAMLAALDRMTSFAGLCGARIPDQLTHIFAHEAAHIFDREFTLRYFTMPGFGEGIFQEAGMGGNFSLATGELPGNPRSIYL